MPFNCTSWPSMPTRSSSLTPSSSAAWAMAAASNRKAQQDLKPILDPGRTEGGARAPRRVALHVHGHGVHGDVRRSSLDMHRERSRVAAQPLGTDAERVDCAGELLLELRALGVFAARAERPGRSRLGEVHAEVRGAPHAHADDGRRAGLASGLEHAVDDEGLDRVDAFGGHRHAQPGIVLRARAFRHHLDGKDLGIGAEVDVDHRDAAPGRRMLVHPRRRMHDRGTERVLARRARAPAADRLLECNAVDFDAAADPHVVDRDAGVLAQEIVGLLGDRDVPDHGAEHALRAGVGLAPRDRCEALLDVRRQDLERADVELLRGFLDLAQIDLHFTSILRSRTTLAQSTVSSFIARAISSGVLPTGASPCAYRRALRSLASSAFFVSWYTFWIISSEVPVGATMPTHPVFSKPGSVSATGGTPGSCGGLSLQVTPSARTRPELMCGSVAARLVTVNEISPLTRPASAGPSPL